MTGAITVLAGVGGLGFIADLIAEPTMIGYMNGLALTILVGQLPKAPRFTVDASGFLGEAAAFVRGVADGATVPVALAVGGLGLLVILVLRRVLPRMSVVLIVVLSIGTARRQLGNPAGLILTVLQANGASPLTFCASAISICHPAISSWSCTKRAPFIDSIAAYTEPAEPADPVGQRG